MDKIMVLERSENNGEYNLYGIHTYYVATVSWDHSAGVVAAGNKYNNQ